MIRFSVLFLCAGAAVPASADPSFDCTKAQSSVEALICTDETLGTLDGRLAERYGAALAAAEGLDAGAKAAVQNLRATQRGWIGGRDECWKADDLRSCAIASYLRREAELVALWMLEPATATAFWACEDNAEVVAMFFDTKQPAARLEIGDSVRAAALVPTASGSRYEGNFGEYLWTKGDAATYRAPDPEGTEWACILRAGQ